MKWIRVQFQWAPISIWPGAERIGGSSRQKKLKTKDQSTYWVCAMTAVHLALLRCIRADSFTAPSCFQMVVCLFARKSARKWRKFLVIFSFRCKKLKIFLSLSWIIQTQIFQWVPLTTANFFQFSRNFFTSLFWFSIFPTQLSFHSKRVLKLCLSCVFLVGFLCLWSSLPCCLDWICSGNSWLNSGFSGGEEEWKSWINSGNSTCYLVNTCLMRRWSRTNLSI